MFGAFVQQFTQNVDVNKLNSVGFWLHSIQNQPQYQQDAPPPPKKYQARVFDGSRKALLIGINYFRQSGELRGCINDVHLMKELIMQRGFSDDPSSMYVLTEEQGSTLPTRNNILGGIQWLVQDAQPGDNLFFHYSGHGTRVPDHDGDEDDGYDEALCPLDYQTAGVITDDVINMSLIKPLPRECRLTIVFDCCHSGTACDLPYIFQADDKHMESWQTQLPHMVVNKLWELKIFNDIFKQHSSFGDQLFKKYKSLCKSEQDDDDDECKFVKEGCKDCLAEVVMLSGCCDHQTSADVSNTACFDVDCGPGGAGGACTNALAEALEDGGDFTYVEVLEKMRESLKRKGFKQFVCLSSSIEIPMDAPFSLTDDL